MEKKYVFTDRNKCTMCMTCVRVCPVHANKVFEDYVEPIPNLCISCGDCVKHCPEGARIYVDETDKVLGWIRNGEKVIAILAPAYVAHFHPVSPLKLVSALKKVGFSEVHEVAVGAELTTLGVLEDMKRNPEKKFITSPCPSIVNLVKKWLPELVDYLSPVDSPMIALGVYLRKKKPRSKIVFIGPCIAKKTEIEDPNVEGVVDLVLTFEDIEKIFDSMNIIPLEEPEELFDGFQPYIGASYPISGGLMRTAVAYSKKDLDMVLDTDILVIEGKDRVVPFLKKYLMNIKNGREDLNPKVVDILYCEGCIDGPAMRSDITVPEKKKIVAEYTKNRIARKRFGKIVTKQRLAKELIKMEDIEKKIYPQINVFRRFREERASYKMPPEKEILEILKKTNRLGNELNCGACGFETCRDRAIAVLNGLVPWDYCIVYQKERMEEVIKELGSKNNYIRDTIELIEEALTNIRKVSNGMIVAVDDLAKASNSMTEASDRGQEMIEKLGVVENEIRKIGKLITEAVGNVVEEMDKLKEIVGMIDSIAEQTKLLALNAAIESAHLGEQGKAFSVIADEIRHLAAESARSLEEVRGIVETINRGFNYLKNIAGEIEEVNEEVEKSTEVVMNEFENIKELLNVFGSSVEEVTASIEEVKAAIDDITKSVMRVLST